MSSVPEITFNRRPFVLLVVGLILVLGIYWVGNRVGKSTARYELRQARELERELETLETKRADLEETLTKSKNGELSDEDRNRLFERFLGRELDKLKEEISLSKPKLTDLQESLGLEEESSAGSD